MGKKSRERSTPQSRALNCVLKRIDSEIVDFEKTWATLVQNTRGKLDLIFSLAEATERLRKIRLELRKKLSREAFEENQLDERFRDFSRRINIIKKSIPPLVISQDGNKKLKIVG